MTLEKQTAAEILAALSRGAVRLFRNNVGMAWHSSRTTKYRDGSLVLHEPRVIRFGLFKGSSDYIGWVSVTITQEMVGRKLAVFTAVEMKREKKGGKRTDEQRNFIKTVKAAGGRAGFATTIDEARKILEDN